MSASDEYETATPVYGCKKCKKTFPCKRDQLLHKKEVHFQAKSSFECKQCSKFFCNSGNLERHMKVHNDVRPFVCRICEKAFAQSVNLQRHYSVHNGERPYQCSFCSKSFTQQSNMHRHQLTHTGEKPFRCKRCGRYFSQRVNLKKHIMGHLNAKPYSCKICQKSFIQLTNFKRHLQSHIKEGIDVDVTAAVEAASVEARQTSDMLVQPVAFECALCRSVFDNFTNFEMHEHECHEIGNNQQQLGHQSHSNNHNVHHQTAVEHLEAVHEDILPDGFTEMKYAIPHLDTHEIIIETSR